MTLLLETATDICSVALAHEGRIVAERTAGEVHQHARYLTLFIQQVLERANATVADLSEIVLSDGPGSYTSLRVGAATAKGLCLARPTLTFSVVPTLTALAHAARPPAGEERILAVLNSRRGEVYGQLFAATDQRSPLTEVSNVRLTDPRWRGTLLDGVGRGRVFVCGPGTERLRQALPPEDNAFTFGTPLTCAAAQLLFPPRRYPELASYEPFYLNPPFVTQSRKKPLL